MNIGAVRLRKAAARMKQVLTPRLTDTCSIAVPTFAKDAYGGTTVASTATQTGVDCLAQVMDDGSERDYEGVLKSRQGYFVFLAAGTAVAMKSTITVNSVVLEVVAIDNPLSDEPLRRVACAKIT